MQSLDPFVHISEPVKDAAGVAVSSECRSRVSLLALTLQSGAQARDTPSVGLH